LDLIIFFDACRFSSNAGEIKTLRHEEISTFATSTHTSSISFIISYIHKLSNAAVEVIGINIKNAHFIQKISTEIKESADSLITIIQNETR
jgi:hydrogenase maturation protease